MWEAPPLSSLQQTLADLSTPVGMRMRAIYFLRQKYENHSKSLVQCDIVANTDDEKSTASALVGIDTPLTVIHILSTGLDDIRHGALLRHEFAYVLGQLRDERAIPALERILGNDADDVMVRHECAEALGAIGSARSIPLLTKYADDDMSIEVGQTCRLALDFIQWKLSGREGEDAPMACACMLSPYSSVDPAPPHPEHAALPCADIGSILLDESAPMFERYRAMFSLRNRGGKESVKELGNALGESLCLFECSSSIIAKKLPLLYSQRFISKVRDKSSALLRHEVAYVLGQMQHPNTVEYLVASLKQQNEHRLVRHESAEALGAIEERWGECEAVLKQFLEDDNEVVRQSCMVALDAADYWAAGQDQFTNKSTDKTNFSLHKAESNGKQSGVLHNHFNVSD